MFSDDHDDILVAARYNYYTDSLYRLWIGATQGAHFNSNVIYHYQSGRVEEANWSPDIKNLYCPNDSTDPTDSTPWDGFVTPIRIPTSYVSNRHITEFYDSNGLPNTPYAKTVHHRSTYPKLSKVAYFADDAPLANTLNVKSYYFNIYGQLPALRHNQNKNANVLFLDGHVEPVEIITWNNVPGHDPDMLRNNDNIEVH